MEARENGHDWPILLNERHKVSEGAGACIALVRDGPLEFAELKIMPIRRLARLHNRFTREFITATVRCKLRLRGR